jgi:hypothetical protein
MFFGKWLYERRSKKRPEMPMWHGDHIAGTIIRNEGRQNYDADKTWLGELLESKVMVILAIIAASAFVFGVDWDHALGVNGVKFPISIKVAK